jgi:hypothetical protein
VLSALPGPAATFFAWRGILPDAFFPVFLWLFVREFPRVLHFSALDRLVAQGLAAAVVVSFVAFMGNAIAAVMRPDSPEQATVFGWLARDHEPGVMWLLLFAVVLPAFVVGWYRRRDAVPEERNRTTLFVAGLVLGFAPTILYVILTVLFPPVARISADPGRLAVMRWIGHTFLIGMAVVTAYAVRAERVLDVRPAIGYAARRLLLPSTLAAAIFVPLAALVAHLYTNRAATLEAILSTRQSRLLMTLAILSSILLVVREPVQRRLDRIFFRERPDLEPALPRITARLHSSGRTDVVAAQIETEVREGLGVDLVNLLLQADDHGPYVRVGGPGRSLPPDSALTVLARAAAGPLVVDPEAPGTTFELLPEADRHWVLDGSVGLIVPVCDSGGHTRWVIVVGRGAAGRPFTPQERQFLDGLAPAAALALENSAFRAGGGPPRPLEETSAGQCRACGRLYARAEGRCACGGPLMAAPLPLELNAKFRLVSEAGRGGMGVVFQAEDVALSRSVALKTLPRISAGRSARLRTEARAMAALTHPHLALIFGAESWRGTPVLVMEYLAGGTLASRLSRGVIPTAEALDVCAKIADALAAMHGRGLIHRDVKPSNVGFTAEGVPKLLDFGLAHLLEERVPQSAWPLAEAAQQHATPLGRIPGTVLYLPPEVMAGGPSGVGQDLWSLALVLYECLVGPELLRAAVRRSRASGSADPFPGLEALRGEQPLSGRIAAFLGQALSRDVRRRPSSARDFADALRRLPPVPPVSLFEKQSSDVRRE